MTATIGGIHLSAQQVRVVAGVRRGQSYQTIAAAMGISRRTVAIYAEHRGEIRKSGRAAAVSVAVPMGPDARRPRCVETGDLGLRDWLGRFCIFAEPTP